MSSPAHPRDHPRDQSAAAHDHDHAHHAHHAHHGDHGHSHAIAQDADRRYLGVALALEAMRMLQDGVASAEDIDAAMTLGYKHPMGPLKTTDVVGLDVRLAIAEHLAREIGDRFEPPTILRQKVAAGHLGRKTGQGFYTW